MTKVDNFVDIGFTIMMAGYGLVLGTVAVGAALYALDNYGLPIYSKDATVTAVYSSSSCRNTSKRVSVNIDGQIAEGCYSGDFAAKIKTGDVVSVDTEKTRFTGVISFNGITRK